MLNEIQKRLECVAKCNNEIGDIINEVGPDDGSKKLTARQWEIIRRASADIVIAMDVNDDEPITENWYSLFSEK